MSLLVRLLLAVACVAGCALMAYAVTNLSGTESTLGVLLVGVPCGLVGGLAAVKVLYR